MAVLFYSDNGLLCKWYVGNPVPKGLVPRLSKIEATGEELSYIREKYSGVVQCERQPLPWNSWTKKAANSLYVAMLDRVKPTDAKPETPTSEVVHHGVRWANNILVELVGNHGCRMSDKKRELLKQATCALSEFLSA